MEGEDMDDMEGDMDQMDMDDEESPGQQIVDINT